MRITRSSSSGRWSDTYSACPEVLPRELHPEEGEDDTGSDIHCRANLAPCRRIPCMDDILHAVANPINCVTDEVEEAELQPRLQWLDHQILAAGQARLNH